MLLDVVTAYVEGATSDGLLRGLGPRIAVVGAAHAATPVGIDHHDLIDSDAVGEAGELTRDELLDG